MKLSINEIRQLQKGLRVTLCNIKDDELYKKLNTELGLMYAENEIEKFKEINKSLRDGFKDLCKTVRCESKKEQSDECLHDLINDINAIKSVERVKTDLGVTKKMIINLDSGFDITEESRKRITKFCYDNEYFYLKLD